MDAIERHVTLPADLAEAWELITRPDDLAGWLGSEVVLDPTPGAAGLVVDHDGTRRRLIVDEVEQGRRIAWHWWPDSDDGDLSRVEITLAPEGDSTVVRVAEQLVEVGPAAATAQASARATDAWAHRLLHLESLLLIAAAVRG